MRLLSTLLLLLLCSASTFADRRLAEENGWIYNDLSAGFKEASTSGKPLMVVIRCPP